VNRITQQILSESEVLEKLRSKRTGLGYRAMFSSYLGGVVTDPALMQIPIDDHLVHRGHGVFDTCTLGNGYLYRLSIHLDRLLQSAELARIDHPWSKTELAEIITETASISGAKNGSVRYWLSVGPGGFSPSPEECEEACFYCIVFDPVSLGGASDSKLKGIPEATVRGVPMKPPLLAKIKSNNYLLNVLTHMEAVDLGGTFGILVDDGGYVAESCVLNAAFVDKRGVLRTPPFDGILTGTTIQRCMDLAQKQLIPEGLLTGLEQAPVKASDVTGDQISEMFVCGGDTHIYPVTSWDGIQVGQGKVGSVTQRLIELVEGEADGSVHGDPGDYTKVYYKA
jgi:4-amino-4-deoxychorismate lyase